MRPCSMRPPRRWRRRRAPARIRARSSRSSTRSSVVCRRDEHARVVDRRLRLARPVAVVVRRQVVRDADQPRPQRPAVGLLLRALEVPVGLQERLLREVLGVVVVAHPVVRVRVDVAQMRLVERRRRRRPAGPSPRACALRTPCHHGIYAACALSWCEVTSRSTGASMPVSSAATSRVAVTATPGGGQRVADLAAERGVGGGEYQRAGAVERGLRVAHDPDRPRGRSRRDVLRGARVLGRDHPAREEEHAGAVRDRCAVALERGRELLGRDGEGDEVVGGEVAGGATVRPARRRGSSIAREGGARRRRRR